MEFTEGLSIKEAIIIKSRTYFSMQHIQSASLFTRHSFQIEKNFDGTFSDELIAEHRAFVTGAIFMSASFIEASINEFFADAHDHPEGKSLANLTP